MAVTPQLIVLDDGGWYQKIRLHYFLTIGRQYLAERDAIVAHQLMICGNGNLFLPDFNCSQLGAIVGTMEVLGIPVLLANYRRKLHGEDGELQQLAAIAVHNRSEIKTILNIGLAANASPITVIRRLLDKIGYGLACIGREKIEGKSVRLYQLSPPKDGRERAFKQWLLKDSKLPGSSEGGLAFYETLKSLSPEKESEAQGHVQLCLNLDLPPGK